MLAASHGNKGGAQSHFGFAKTYIATHQTVHGAWADHVLDNGVDSGTLVGGFVKAKVVGKHFVIGAAVAESMAFTGGTAGVDIEQLGSSVAHLFSGFALGFFPLAAAQFVQRSFFR